MQSTTNQEEEIPEAEENRVAGVSTVHATMKEKRNITVRIVIRTVIRTKLAGSELETVHNLALTNAENHIPNPFCGNANSIQIGTTDKEL